MSSLDILTIKFLIVYSVSYIRIFRDNLCYTSNNNCSQSTFLIIRAYATAITALNSNTFDICKKKGLKTLEEGRKDLSTNFFGNFAFQKTWE